MHKWQKRSHLSAFPYKYRGIDISYEKPERHINYIFRNLDSYRCRVKRGGKNYPIATQYKGEMIFQIDNILDADEKTFYSNYKSDTW